VTRCPNCGEVPTTLAEYLYRGGARFACRACGEPLVRSLWIVPVQMFWTLAFFAGLLLVVSREFTNSLPVFVGLVGVAAAAVAGARYSVWRYVAVRRAPPGRAMLYRAAVATVPGLVGGLWALAWVHSAPVLGGILGFVVVWGVAVLSVNRET
jgi:hypothetical protein